MYILQALNWIVQTKRCRNQAQIIILNQQKSTNYFNPQKTKRRLRSAVKQQSLNARPSSMPDQDKNYFIIINLTLRNMLKKPDMSYMSGRTLSHASLQKFRKQPNVQSVKEYSKQSHKDAFNAKPNIKYYSNGSQSNIPTVAKSQQQKIPVANLKSEEELKKRIKLLENQVKRKLNSDSHLAKLLKCKNTSEISVIDLYAQFNRVEEELHDKSSKVAQLQAKIESLSNQVEEIFYSKEEQETKHTEQVTSFLNKLQKIEKRHSQEIIIRDRALNEQRRGKQEKDILLRQVRKKYQEVLQNVRAFEIQNNELRKSKQLIENAYQQKIQNIKEDYAMKMQQFHTEREEIKRQLRQKQMENKKICQQRQVKGEQAQKSIKRLESELKEKERECCLSASHLNQLKYQINQLEDKLLKLTQQKNQLDEIVKDLNRKIEESENKFKAVIHQLNLEINEGKHQASQLETKNKKQYNQIKKLQQKINDLTTACKNVSFDRDQKQCIIDKLKQVNSEKEKKVQDKQKYIDELQCKVYNLQKVSNSSIQTVKKLEKQIAAKQESNIHHSKLQIQNYKCIGRLTELIHQVQLLGSIEKKEKQIKDKNKGLKKNKKPKDGQNTFTQDYQPQTVTECIDILTKQIEVYLKKSINNLQQENKVNKQLIEDIVCDIKSIFHAYNSFIQDGQLTSGTREYLQCLDSKENIDRKTRNGYLQVILERLISMIAIQSYTSENGMKRQNDSKKKTNYISSKDSLQNTHSGFEQLDSNYNYEKQPKVVRKYDRRPNNATKEKQKNVRIMQSRRKSSRKLYTQPNEFESIPLRRLDYGKQNYLNRINLNQQQQTKYHYNSVQEPSEKYRRYLEESKSSVTFRSKFSDSANIQGKQVGKQKIEGTKVPGDSDLIERKYFR